MKLHTPVLCLLGSMLMSLNQYSCQAHDNCVADNVINLGKLYKKENNRYTTGNSGNFIRTTTGEVLFFVPFQRKLLMEILAGKKAPASVWIQVFDYTTNSCTLNRLLIRADGGILQIGTYKIESQELDRLRLPPAWNAVYDYCASQRHISEYSVTKLDKDLFFISGGIVRGRYSTGAPYQEKSAFIFDSSSRRVIKEYSLSGSWTTHFSFVLPGDRVLLAADTDTGANLEIVDVKTGTSKFFQGLGRVGYSYGTACLDSEGYCYFIGGIDTYPGNLLVRRVKIQDGSISAIGKLHRPRSFNLRNCDSMIPLNAICLSSGRFLVSGGTSTTNTTYKVDFRRDAELFSTK